MKGSDEILAFVFFAGVYVGWFSGIFFYRLIRRAMEEARDEDDFE